MPSGLPTPEPFLIGDELISISLNPFQIEFHFSRDRVEIGGNFELCREGHSSEMFLPSEKSGRVEALWPLIGHLVSSIQWEIGINGKQIEIAFEDGALLRILPSDSFRGTITGKNPPPGVFMIEDF